MCVVDFTLMVAGIVLIAVVCFASFLYFITDDKWK